MFTLCTSKSSGEQILEVNCSEQRWSKRSRKNVVIVMWHCIFSHVEFRLFTWTKTHYNYEIWKVKEKKLVSFKFLNILLTNRFRISGPGSASNHVPGRREITIYHERVDFVVLLSTFSVFST